MTEIAGEISRLAIQYADAIGAAIRIKADLELLDPAFHEMQHAPSAATIDEIRNLSNAAVSRRIHRQAAARSAAGFAGGTTYNIGGDMISVGEIHGGRNIAIGKEIDQQNEEYKNDD